MSVSLVPSQSATIEDVPSDTVLDKNVGPPSSFSIEVQDVPGFSLQDSVYRKATQRTQNIVVKSGEGKSRVSEGMLRLSLTKTVPPRTVMIKVNKERRWHYF